MATHERKAIIFLLLLLILTLFSFSGCSEADDVDYYSSIKSAEFSVTYIDVGEGNAVFVNFPDGKNVLIDCGSASEGVYKNIKQVLISLEVDEIDYLILSHIDEQHIGNSEKIITDYTVENAFIPYIEHPEKFPLFNDFLFKATKNDVNLLYSEVGQKITGENYYLVFLSPKTILAKDGAYAIFNSQIEPTTQQADDLSPIIFLNYAGSRFLFTGDATATQEEYVVGMFNSNVYKHYFGANINVDLNCIDYLMLSNGGDDSGSSSRFLSLLKPTNAIISVGGSNNMWHPSTTVLTRLFEVNEYCNLYRTDVYGNISVVINKLTQRKIIYSIKQ